MKINTSDGIQNNSRLIQAKTSGRSEIWLYTIKNYNIRNLIGYGSQGDRFFLKDKTNFGDNSSNSIIYSLLSGGYIGLICLILIYSELIKKIIFRIINGRVNNNNNIYYNFSLSLIFFMLIRSIFENSFALFSIDFLQIIISYSIVEIYQNKIIKKNEDINNYPYIK